jgi:lipopolysaccharide export system permease protein
LAQTWVEQGTIGKMPGVWWLYVLMALAAFAMLAPGFRQKLFVRR